MGISRSSVMAATACALAWTAPLPARAQGADVYARLFPYAFASEGAAVEGCRGLTDPVQIAQASRGALVYLQTGGSPSLVPHGGVAALTRAITDPGDAGYPGVAKAERRSADSLSAIAWRQGQPDRGGVRCTFMSRSGSLRLVSIEIIIPRPTRTR